MIAKVLFFVGVIAVMSAAVGAFMIRYVGHDTAIWHVDPLAVPTPTTPNSFRVAPVFEGLEAVTDQRIDMTAPIYDANPALISSAFDEFVLRQPRTERIAGAPETGWMTYVQRSETLQFPDYISVLFYDLGSGQSTVAIFSRSRFGRSDIGVNEARVSEWLAAFESFETDR